MISELGELVAVDAASGEINLRQTIAGFTRGYGLAVVGDLTDSSSRIVTGSR